MKLLLMKQFWVQRKALYCAKHKKDGMVNIKDPTCCHQDCTTQPTYNFTGEKKALYCAKHKKDGMVDIKSPTCCHQDCTTRPNYNFTGEKKALYCAKHKKDGMVDIKHSTCCAERCTTRISNIKYEGYCLRCFIYLFPGKPVSRNYKTKEYSVVEFVKNNFPRLNWIADKTKML